MESRHRASEKPIRVWSLNGRFLTQPRSGVQRYAREIIRCLDAHLDSGHPLTERLKLEILLPSAGELSDAFKNIDVRRVGHLSGHLWEQIELPAHARGHILSLCNTGPVVRRDQIVCIHDLNTRTYPSSYSRSFRLLYRGLLPVIGRAARSIVTVSQYSAKQLAQHRICPHNKITIIPNGHEHAARWAPTHSPITQTNASLETVVLMGSTIPHKNARLLLGMADRLADAGLKLAVVGNPDASVFNGCEVNVNASNVIWLGRISDNELAALLRDCLCLAFPSFEEGFGLPLLEAMAVGSPIVASDRASIPEICGDAAIYASPECADQWLDRFVQLRRLPELRIRLIERGRRRLNHYRWVRSAEQYLFAMASLDGFHQTATKEQKNPIAQHAHPERL